MWLPFKESWVEVRSTEHESISGLGLRQQPPEGSELHEGVYSVVSDRESNDLGLRQRLLPTLYFGTQPIYSHRETAALVDRLEEYLEAARRAQDHSVYALHPFKKGSVSGLYGRDMFERSHFRRALQREGFRFSAHPFVELTSEGVFRTSEWEDFQPSFVLLGGESDEPDPQSVGGALAPFTVARYRLGIVPPSELVTLVEAVGALDCLSGGDPDAFIDRVEAGA